MISIGVIANPASGKDIRRLVSYATTIDNAEKVNIVKRITLAAQAMDVGRVMIMPDTFRIANRIIDDLTTEKTLRTNIEIANIKLTGSMVDSVEAAKEMRAQEVGCIIVLGGDGTSRAVSKELGDVPLIPVSTGTNNVYPMMLEGTSVGMAAAAIAQMENPYDCCLRDKRIELSVNGGPMDIALIDAIISDELYIGAKAIWDPSRIRQVVVSRCSPANIGFSSIAGCVEIVHDYDAHGYTLQVSDKGRRVKAPIAAGVLAELRVTGERFLKLDEPMTLRPDYNGIIALDGERELKFRAGDEISLVVRQNGPWRVNVQTALAKAKELGMFY